MGVRTIRVRVGVRVRVTNGVGGLGLGLVLGLGYISQLLVRSTGKIDLPCEPIFSEELAGNVEVLLFFLGCYFPGKFSNLFRIVCVSHWKFCSI